MSQSEVARLLTRIEQEYASARSGLDGLASGTTRLVVETIERL